MTEPHSTHAWASVDQVADHLKVSRDTVRRMIARGDIEARRFGPKIIRIDLNQLYDSSAPVILTESSA